MNRAQVTKSVRPRPVRRPAFIAKPAAQIAKTTLPAEAVAILTRAVRSGRCA